MEVTLTPRPKKYIDPKKVLAAKSQAFLGLLAAHHSMTTQDNANVPDARFDDPVLISHPETTIKAPEMPVLGGTAPSVNRIVAVVAAHYGLTTIEMLSHYRAPHIARARQLAYYLARTLTGYSLPQIGRLMKKDHSTIYHGIATTKKLIAADEVFRADVEKLTNTLTTPLEG